MKTGQDYQEQEMMEQSDQEQGITGEAFLPDESPDFDTLKRQYADILLQLKHEKERAGVAEMRLMHEKESLVGDINQLQEERDNLEVELEEMRLERNKLRTAVEEYKAYMEDERSQFVADLTAVEAEKERLQDEWEKERAGLQAEVKTCVMRQDKFVDALRRRLQHQFTNLRPAVLNPVRVATRGGRQQDLRHAQLILDHLYIALSEQDGHSDADAEEGCESPYQEGKLQMCAADSGADVFLGAEASAMLLEGKSGAREGSTSTSKASGHIHALLAQLQQGVHSHLPTAAPVLKNERPAGVDARGSCRTHTTLVLEPQASEEVGSISFGSRTLPRCAVLPSPAISEVTQPTPTTSVTLPTAAVHSQPFLPTESTAETACQIDNFPGFVSGTPTRIPNLPALLPTVAESAVLTVPADWLNACSCFNASTHTATGVAVPGVSAEPPSDSAAMKGLEEGDGGIRFKQTGPDGGTRGDAESSPAARIDSLVHEHGAVEEPGAKSDDATGGGAAASSGLYLTAPPLIGKPQLTEAAAAFLSELRQQQQLASNPISLSPTVPTRTVQGHGFPGLGPIIEREPVLPPAQCTDPFHSQNTAADCQQVDTPNVAACQAADIQRSAAQPQPPSIGEQTCNMTAEQVPSMTAADNAPATVITAPQAPVEANAGTGTGNVVLYALPAVGSGVMSAATAAEQPDTPSHQTPASPADQVHRKTATQKQHTMFGSASGRPPFVHPAFRSRASSQPSIVGSANSSLTASFNSFRPAPQLPTASSTTRPTKAEQTAVPTQQAATALAAPAAAVAALTSQNTPDAANAGAAQDSFTSAGSANAGVTPVTAPERATGIVSNPSPSPAVSAAPSLASSAVETPPVLDKENACSQHDESAVTAEDQGDDDTSSEDTWSVDGDDDYNCSDTDESPSEPCDSLSNADELSRDTASGGQARADSVQANETRVDKAPADEALANAVEANDTFADHAAADEASSDEDFSYVRRRCRAIPEGRDHGGDSASVGAPSLNSAGDAGGCHLSQLQKKRFNLKRVTLAGGAHHQGRRVPSTEGVTAQEHPKADCAFAAAIQSVSAAVEANANCTKSFARGVSSVAADSQKTRTGTAAEQLPKQHTTQGTHSTLPGGALGKGKGSTEYARAESRPAEQSTVLVGSTPSAPQKCTPSAPQKRRNQSRECRDGGAGVAPSAPAGRPMKTARTQDMDTSRKLVGDGGVTDVDNGPRGRGADSAARERGVRTGPGLRAAGNTGTHQASELKHMSTAAVATKLVSAPTAGAGAAKHTASRTIQSNNRAEPRAQGVVHKTPVTSGDPGNGRSEREQKMASSAARVTPTNIARTGHEKERAPQPRSRDAAEARSLVPPKQCVRSTQLLTTNRVRPGHTRVISSRRIEPDEQQNPSACTSVAAANAPLASPNRTGLGYQGPRRNSGGVPKQKGKDMKQIRRSLDLDKPKLQPSWASKQTLPCGRGPDPIIINSLQGAAGFSNTDRSFAGLAGGRAAGAQPHRALTHSGEKRRHAMDDDGRPNKLGRK